MFFEFSKSLAIPLDLIKQFWKYFLIYGIWAQRVSIRVAEKKKLRTSCLQYFFIDSYVRYGIQPKRWFI